MQVSPSVRAVQVPEEDPGRPVYTCIYLIGKGGAGQALTIDSGEAIDKFRWMLRGYLAATERAEVALAAISHYHFDHSGNLAWFREFLGADVLVTDTARPFLEQDGRLPAQGVQPLREGQAITLDGGVRVQVLPTPGHSPDSLCYYIEEEGVLFTGDTLLGSSTTVVFDLAAYRRSLRQLVALPKLDLICPGHGELVRDPRERLQQYIDHRDVRERQILAVLAAGGPVTSWDIMLKIYTDINPRLRRSADTNVRSHLKELADNGRIAVYPGVRKDNTTSTTAEIAEHERREGIKQEAAQIKKEEQAALIAAQENPPQDEWVEPPHYEIVGTARE